MARGPPTVRCTMARQTRLRTRSQGPLRPAQTTHTHSLRYMMLHSCSRDLWRHLTTGVTSLSKRTPDVISVSDPSSDAWSAQWLTERSPQLFASSACCWHVRGCGNLRLRKYSFTVGSASFQAVHMQTWLVAQHA